MRRLRVLPPTPVLHPSDRGTPQRTTPAAAFRPAPIDPVAATPPPEPLTLAAVAEVPVPQRHLHPLPSPAASAGNHDVRAVEWEAALSPIGRLLLPGNQQLKFAAALATRTVTVWADDRSIHVLLDGHLIRTRPSRFSVHDLRDLLLRGGRIAGPEPGPSALAPGVLPATSLIELDRTVARDGYAGLGGHKVMLDPALAGQQVTLRFEGQLMHVVAEGRLVKTLPAPVEPQHRGKLTGARVASSPLPPPPALPLRALRRVAENGLVMVAGQRLRVGRTYAGQTVVVAIEDTVLRVLLDDVELSTHARKNDKPITRFKAYPHRQTS